MKSEFDYGEVVDNIDLVNAYGTDNRIPHDPMADNRVGIGMPVPTGPNGSAPAAQRAVRTLTNAQIIILIFAVAIIIYLAYQRGKDGGKKLNPHYRPRYLPEQENEKPEDEMEDQEDDLE